MPTVPKSAGYDLEFIDVMSKHHRAAIEMATMAQMKIEHAGLKALAMQIPGDQQKEIDRMQAWREQWYAGAPIVSGNASSGMGSGMGMDMDMKDMEPGQAYDAMFIDMMLPHHERAVAMSKTALASAHHEEIRALAQQIIDAQTREIAQMKEWKASLGKASGAHQH